MSRLNFCGIKKHTYAGVLGPKFGAIMQSHIAAAALQLHKPDHEGINPGRGNHPTIWELPALPGT